MVRKLIIRIAKDMNIEVIERTIDRTELYTCDEAFLCGSAMEITPIIAVDKYKIAENDEIGKITSIIHMRYLEIVSGKKEDFITWLTVI